MIPEAVQQDPVASALITQFGGAIQAGSDDRGELSLEVSADRIVQVCAFLKQHEKFERLSGITAVDWYPREPRFEIVYHLQSVARKLWIRLKIKAGGAVPEADSVYGVYRCADWYEREIFDLFGVGFRNHPDLKRILMPENWKGHPLRKDYPVHGYKYSYADEV